MTSCSLSSIIICCEIIFLAGWSKTFHPSIIIMQSFIYTINYSSSSALSWVNNVTTGTEGILYVMANVVPFASLDNTHLTDQIKIRLIWQLVKAIQEFSKSYLNILMASFFNIFCTISTCYACYFLFIFKRILILLLTWKLLIAPAAVKAGSSL